MAGVNAVLDLEELREDIRNMTRDQAIYKVLKEELSALGYWKSLPRGNPQAGYKKSRTAISRG